MLSRAILLCLLLATPADVTAQDGADPAILNAANNLQPRVGQNLNRTMRLTAARAEGRILVLGIELSSESSDMTGPTQVAAILATGICQDTSDATFFGEGRGLRVSVTRAGRALGSAAIDHCPGPIGQGATPATFAGAMQSLVGTAAGDGSVSITSLRAEGDTLIVVFDVLRRGVPVDQIGPMFLTGFCRRDDAQTIYFDHGFKLRVDTTYRGDNLRAGPLITACPRPRGS